MSAEKNIEKSIAQLKEVGECVNTELVEKIVKRLGIANQSMDASHVAASDKSEVERLKKNFVIKKLEQPDTPETQEAIDQVLERMKPIKFKQRGAVYYLLTRHFGKEKIYVWVVERPCLGTLDTESVEFFLYMANFKVLTKKRRLKG